MKGVQRTIRRRRREAKTDYASRTQILKSGKPRIVIRKTNRYIIIQVVKSDIAKDSVVFHFTSKELLSNGWPSNLSGSLKSLAAAYLAGLLFAQKSNEKEAIIDIGMHRNVKKGRLYAVLKGLVDGGMKIPHNPEAFPDEKRLEENKKTREAFLLVKEKLTENGRERNKK